MAYNSLKTQTPKSVHHVARWSRLSALSAGLVAAGVLSIGSADAATCPLATTCSGPIPETFTYSSLNPGDGYDLRVEEFYGGEGGNLLFEVFKDAGLTELIGSKTLGADTSPNLVHHFTGTLETDFLGLKVSSVSGCCEGYNLRLDITPQSVPEPASAALLAIGLAGAFVARRRKRS